MAGSVKLSSGYDFPYLGLGTWQAREGEVKAAVKTALEHGYRHIDCAHVYDNEAEVGEALEECFKSGIVKREDVYIVSKLWSTRHHKEDVKGGLENTLKKLRLTYLDLYLIHWPICLQKGEVNFPEGPDGKLLFDDVSPVETWEGMEECVKAGLTRSIGLSNYNSHQIKEILSKCTIKPAVLQVEVHPYLQQHKLVDFCNQHGIVVTGYSCLGAGARPWLRAGEKRLLDDPVVKEIANRLHKSPAQVVIRWLLQRKVVAIPKSANPGRIKENFSVADFELDAEDMEKIRKLDQGLRLIVPAKDVSGKSVELFKEAAHYPFHVEF